MKLDKNEIISLCVDCGNQFTKKKWHKNKIRCSACQKNRVYDLFMARKARDREKTRLLCKTKYKNKINEYARRRYHKLKNSNPEEYKKLILRKSISVSVRRSIKSKKNCSVFIKLGYSLQDLINNIESKFIDGMTWDNYGKWHIDHTIPLSYFNYKSVDDINFKLCWSLDNLKPMWAHDNMSKGNRYIL